jgi:hypothetical protein
VNDKYFTITKCRGGFYLTFPDISQMTKGMIFSNLEDLLVELKKILE